MISVVALGALALPTATARPSTAARFEVAGIICEHKSRTYVNGANVRDFHHKFPPDPNVPVAEPAILYGCVRSSIALTNFRWPRKWIPASSWVANERAMDYSAVKGTVTKKSFTVSSWQYLEDGTVMRRFDGFPLNRPYLTTSAIDALSYPSTCDPLDSPIVTTSVKEGREALFDEALKVDPDLRVRELLNGKREVVTYKTDTAAAQRLAADLKASLCIEPETDPPQIREVMSLLTKYKIEKRTAFNYQLPTGRTVVIVGGVRIPHTVQAELLASFGSHIAIDALIRE
jgi:hypothetical protein